MKIYTKTGDGGETGLFGGRRVSKSDLRVAAYGDVDELNACLGWALVHLEGSPLEEDLRWIQSDLFTLGADLATPTDAAPAASSRVERIGPERVQRLEILIDRLDGEIPPLRQFILPGGTPGAAALQVARAVCRRAERQVVRLSGAETVNATAIVYLNRLSDLLFVLARWVNARSGVGEPLWKGSGEGGGADT